MKKAILGAVMVMMMCVGLAIAFDDKKQCYADCHAKCMEEGTEVIAAEDNGGASNHHAVHKRVRCDQKCHKKCGGEGLGYHGGDENGKSCYARCFHKCMRGHHHDDEYDGDQVHENGNSRKKTRCAIKCHKECHGSPST